MNELMARLRPRRMIRSARRRLAAVLWPPVTPAPVHTFCTAAPTGRNALELFAGEWSSRLPAPYDDLGGSSPLFADGRLAKALECLGGADGKTVLELGPLDGGHTHQLHGLGAASITAIEANERAYLRCLVVKETFGLDRASVLYGDMRPYLADPPQRFDLAVAFGVLYHLDDPMPVLQNLTDVADQLAIWTHYYDAGHLADKPHVAAKFGARTTATTTDGYDYALHHYSYEAALDRVDFSGGTLPFSRWLGKDDLIGYLDHRGFKVNALIDDYYHPHGPCIVIAAHRR